MFDLHPNIPLADEDEKEEETPQHVEAVNDSEEEANDVVFLARLTIVVVDDEVDTFDDPQNTKNQEKFDVKDLELNRATFYSRWSYILSK